MCNQGDAGPVLQPGGSRELTIDIGVLVDMDIDQSKFTDKLVTTVSCAVTDEEDKIIGVLGCDIQLEQLLKHAQEIDTADDDAESDA